MKRKYTVVEKRRKGTKVHRCKLPFSFRFARTTVIQCNKCGQCWQLNEGTIWCRTRALDNNGNVL